MDRLPLSGVCRVSLYMIETPGVAQRSPRQCESARTGETCGIREGLVRSAESARGPRQCESARTGLTRGVREGLANPAESALTGETSGVRGGLGREALRHGRASPGEKYQVGAKGEGMSRGVGAEIGVTRPRAYSLFG
ncbi:hypothetical protein ACLB2K_052199 [Fragaria x ananassa]